MNEESRERLVQLLTASQTRLYGFILTLIPDRNTAKDVLQDTNLVIWRKADEFQEGTNFWAWSAQIAHFRVLAHYRDTGRDLHLFDEGVLERLAVAAQENSADDDRRSALLACLKKLPQRQLEVIQQHYSLGRSIKAIAQEQQQTVAAIKMILYRVRRALLACIEKTLGKREAS